MYLWGMRFVLLLKILQDNNILPDIALLQHHFLLRNKIQEAKLRTLLRFFARK